MTAELLPCQVSDADIRLARDAMRDPIFKTADDIHGRAISSAIYRMANSEVARCYLRLVAAMTNASTIPTDGPLCEVPFCAVFGCQSGAPSCTGNRANRLSTIPSAGELAEVRAERDALLEKPISLAKMDSIDDDATDRMIAYYWWQQAQDARAALSIQTISGKGMREANEELGAWMSAALDDPQVCAEMKADIEAWFAALAESDVTALLVDQGERG